MWFAEEKPRWFSDNMLEDNGFINDNPPLKLEIIEVPGESPYARHNAVISLVYVIYFLVVHSRWMILIDLVRIRIS